MIFAQTNRYGKRQDTFSPDDRQGATVAHADLLRAVVKYADVEAAELYVGASPGRAPIANFEFADLCREFTDKTIRLKNLEQIAELTADSCHVFYASGVFISAVAQARRSLGKRFPICAFSHAIDVPLVSQMIPGALLLAEDCDAVITSSSAGAQALHAMFEQGRQVLGVLAGGEIASRSPRVEVIPLGVDTDELFPRDRAFARTLLHLPQEELVVLYLGRLNEEHKADLEPLFIAFRELLRGFPAATLLLAGHDQDGAYLSELEAMSGRLGIRSNIRFLASFQDFLKPYIYSASDIFVSPSENVQETFGIALVEAMACGLPVVAADWSGYRDLVVNGQTGFLIPTIWNAEAAQSLSKTPFITDSARRHMLSQQTVIPPEEIYRAMHALALQPELRKLFGKRAVERVRTELCWASVIPRHEALWNDLWCGLQRAQPRPPELVDDLNLFFGHFATASLADGMVVVRSVLRADFENALRFRPQRAGYEALDPGELRQIFDRVSLGAVSVRQLIHDGIARNTSGIAWLLKKGFLSIADGLPIPGGLARRAY